ncbi:hypothetical protein U27_03537 [Candidatus Vecturithrix granuli]|uniref:Ice-binding protein C-terminal domain-containing protein n=1 Tax=Vecturithrix granuli TaxID=1499967 RepID=A0A081BW70_VECG1|nr:hypothetical protein U27_03537 [Candidatus Vecturithrix granuli]
MKNLCKYFIGVCVIFVLVAGGIASADSLTVSTEEPDTTLTVVFGLRPEFNSSGGAGLPGFTTNDMTVEEPELTGGDVEEDYTPNMSFNTNELVGGEVNITSGFSASYTPDNVTPPSSGAVPEPGTLILLGLGVLGLLGLARRKKH